MKKSNFRLPNKMPHEHINNIFNNSIESSVISSRSGNIPHKVRTPNHPKIPVEERLEVVTDDGTDIIAPGTSLLNIVNSSNTSRENIKHVDKEYKTQERFNASNEIKHRNQQKKFSTVGDKGFHKNKEISSQKKSRIEVNLEFESMKQMTSKRTIISKNKMSAKSFNSLLIKEQDQISRKLYIKMTKYR
jgi:hypothetical protein